MDAAGPSTPFSTKHIDMGTWNLRTVYQTGKVAHEAAEMTNYKVALVGISETRWTQTEYTQESNYSSLGMRKTMPLTPKWYHSCYQE